MDALKPFQGERNRQFTGDEAFFCDHLCRASLPREHTDAAVTGMRSAEVWSGLAEWIWALAAVATLYPEEAEVVDGGCDVPEVPAVPEQRTTPLDGSASGPAGHRYMR